MAMNKKFKAQWVKALRSGKYKQGRGALCREVDGEEEFCCLGVALDALGCVMPKALWEPSASGDRLWCVGEDSAFLPTEFAEAIGLTGPERSDPHVVDPVTGGKVSLSAINDRGASFDDIADLIEKQL